jgi:hypothetical protein
MSTTSPTASWRHRALDASD